MSVNYRDRNYIVYKGKTIETKDILNTITKEKYIYEDELPFISVNQDFKIIRNLNCDLFFEDYNIHSYDKYIYFMDFDSQSLVLENEYGGYGNLNQLYELADLNEENYYELLPRLLNNSKGSDLAFLLLGKLTPENLSYIIYNKKSRNLNAISIENGDYLSNNYDGVYYSVKNGEQMLSNNPELLSEFFNNVEKLPPNEVYTNGYVRKLKWK